MLTDRPVTTNFWRENYFQGHCRSTVRTNRLEQLTNKKNFFLVLRTGFYHSTRKFTPNACNTITLYANRMQKHGGRRE